MRLNNGETTIVTCHVSTDFKHGRENIQRQNLRAIGASQLTSTVDHGWELEAEALAKAGCGLHDYIVSLERGHDDLALRMPARCH